MFEQFEAVAWYEIVLLVVAGFLGLLWHYVSKLIELRKTRHDLNLRNYFLTHSLETIGSVICLLVGLTWMIAQGFIGKLGLEVLVFAALFGYTIDSQANKFRQRGSRILS